jgi:hypothetical protein
LIIKGNCPDVFLALRVTETGGLYGTGCKAPWPSPGNQI